MELIEIVKKRLEAKGWDFASDYWDDEELTSLHEVILETEAALHQPLVSGSLPMYDVEELNEIIKLFNNREIDLYTCIGRVWNKAYILGCIDGSKGNDR